MKNFINVLYRRILYKIPLKWLLIMLAVFAICFSSFSSAVSINSFNGSRVAVASSTNSSEISVSSTGSVWCFWVGSSACSGNVVAYFDSPSGIGNVALQFYDGGKIRCVNNLTSFHFRNIHTSSCNVGYFSIGKTPLVDNFCSGVYQCPECPSCPTCPDQYTSLECQSEYSLIPVSSVDSEYCESNNLCSSSDCPGGVSNFSNLYINNILHLGVPNIFMNIPEEIDWDYAYTNSGNNMNIDVVGYNVDYTKVQEQIDIQNYKPDNEDLTNIVSTVLPLFVPGLCIILLLYFIFRFIKKIF